MPSRDHYVSQFHLRGFADPTAVGTEEPWLWVGDCQETTIKRRSPKNVAWKRGMFAGSGNLADQEGSLGNYLSREVEGPAAVALSKWVSLPQGNRRSIPGEVYRYVAWAAARSFPMQSLYESWVNDMPLDLENAKLAPPGYDKIRFGGGWHRIEHPTLGIREGVPSEQIHALRKDGWRVRLGENDFLAIVHSQAWYFQVQMFPMLRWVILDAPKVSMR